VSRAPGQPVFSLAEVETVKSSLGPIHHLDLTAHEIARGHYELGTDVGARVRLFLAKKFEPMGTHEILGELRRARMAREAIARCQASASTPRRVSQALHDYLRSLDAWAAGAGLAAFARDDLSGLEVDGDRVSAEDLAMVLQDESNGCQTGVYREDETTVFLWHTEEDRTYGDFSRFDRLRLASFTVAGENGPRTMTGFVYPDLLPGPAFGWSGSNYAHAVDAFYLRPPDGRPGMPANTATWVCLYLAGSMSTADVARALGPFPDGYALSSIWRTETSVRGDTTEFIASTVVSSPLPEAAGSSAFKVNYLSERASQAVSGLEDLHPERRVVLERRVRRTSREIRAVAQSEDRVAGFARLLSSRVGGTFAYSNEAVKAHFLCRMAREETSVWVGPGPAVYEDPLFASVWSPVSAA
jgi:hypothetical protein